MTHDQDMHDRAAFGATVYVILHASNKKPLVALGITISNKKLLVTITTRSKDASKKVVEDVLGPARPLAWRNKMRPIS